MDPTAIASRRNDPQFIQMMNMLTLLEPPKLQGRPVKKEDLLPLIKPYANSFYLVPMVMPLVTSLTHRISQLKASNPPPFLSNQFKSRGSISETMCKMYKKANQVARLTIMAKADHSLRQTQAPVVAMVSRNLYDDSSLIFDTLSYGSSQTVRLKSHHQWKGNFQRLHGDIETVMKACNVVNGQKLLFSPLDMASIDLKKISPEFWSQHGHEEITTYLGRLTTEIKMVACLEKNDPDDELNRVDFDGLVKGLEELKPPPKSDLGSLQEFVTKLGSMDCQLNVLELSGSKNTKLGDCYPSIELHCLCLASAVSCSAIGIRWKSEKIPLGKWAEQMHLVINVINELNGILDDELVETDPDSSVQILLKRLKGAIAPFLESCEKLRFHEFLGSRLGAMSKDQELNIPLLSQATGAVCYKDLTEAARLIFAIQDDVASDEDNLIDCFNTAFLTVQRSLGALYCLNNDMEHWASPFDKRCSSSSSAKRKKKRKSQRKKSESVQEMKNAPAPKPSGSKEKAAMPGQPLAQEVKKVPAPKPSGSKEKAAMPGQPLAQEVKNVPAPKSCGSKEKAAMPGQPLAQEVKNVPAPKPSGSKEKAAIPYQTPIPHSEEVDSLLAGIHDIRSHLSGRARKRERFVKALEDLGFYYLETNKHPSYGHPLFNGRIPIPKPKNGVLGITTALKICREIKQATGSTG